MCYFQSSHTCLPKSLSILAIYQEYIYIPNQNAPENMLFNIYLIHTVI